MILESLSDLPFLYPPPPESKKRRKKVNDELEAKVALYDSRQLTNSLADVFLQFFVTLLGNYRRFFGETSKFERENFIESQTTWELKQVSFRYLSPLTH